MNFRFQTAKKEMKQQRTADRAAFAAMHKDAQKAKQAGAAGARSDKVRPRSDGRTEPGGTCSGLKHKAERKQKHKQNKKKKQKRGR